MDQEHIFSKLKKDVRSLLLSSKVGLDPHQLRKDYIAMLGHPMPLKILGFKTTLDMVKEMPDVVSVVIQEDGTLHLRAVSDETTRNIEELVAKQRTSLADKKRLQLRPSRFFSPRYSYNYRQGQVALPRRGRHPPSLPAHLRVQLRTLLSQGPIQLSQLESRYLLRFGYPLQVLNYGFYSTAEMLQAASDLLVISQSRLGSVLSLRRHMFPRSLINKPPPEPTTNTALERAEERVPSTELKAPEPEALITPNDPQISQAPTESVCAQPRDVDVMRTHQKLIKNLLDCEPGEPQCFEERLIKLEEEFCQQIQENGLAGTISKDLKDKLQKVVAQCHGGVSVHDLPVKYQMQFGEELPLLESGFVSVTELVGALTDVFHLRTEGDTSDSNNWIVSDIQVRHDSHTATDDVGNGFKLQPISSYFSSPWEGHQEEEEPEENTALEHIEKLDSIINSQPQEITYPAIQLHSSPVIPLDAFQCQRLRPPTHYGLQELMAVFVEEVETPGNFYVRFSETKEAQAMEHMMIEMRRCYMCPEVSERYSLPLQFVRRGQVCCVSPKGMWLYRVIIHQVLSPSQVEVYFVDFGAITVVQTCQLKFLKSCYSVLPAQAVPASLVGLKPPTGSWSVEATELFHKMCADHTMVGLLDHYCGDVLLLYLCDTRTDNDIYIHSALLQQGHGVVCSSSASDALCAHVTPISLYLGEGLMDLSEEPEAAAPWSEQPDPVEEDEELPALECIENGEMSSAVPVSEAEEALLSFPVQSNLLSFELNDESLACAELGLGLKEELAQSTAPPDLIQKQETPSFTEDHTVSQVLPTSSPQGDPCTWGSPGLTVPPLVEPCHLLRTLSLHTMDLGQTQRGSPVSPLHLQRKGFIFPLFGAR